MYAFLFGLLGVMLYGQKDLYFIKYELTVVGLAGVVCAPTVNKK